MPAEQRANSSAISLVKISFLFRFKTFPKNDTLTQKRNNVQDNRDVTKQLSLSSIPSIKVRVPFISVQTRRHGNQLSVVGASVFP